MIRYWNGLPIEAHGVTVPVSVQEKTGHDTWCHGVVDRVVFSLVGLDDLSGLFQPSCDSSGDSINFFSQRQGVCLWPECPCILAGPQPQELSIMLPEEFK